MSVDHWHALEASMIEPPTPQTDENVSPRFGRAFGKIMQQHPDADARLVNDILRIAWAEAAAPALDVERHRPIAVNGAVEQSPKALAGILRDANIGCEDHQGEHPHLSSRHLEDAAYILDELARLKSTDPEPPA